MKRAVRILCLMVVVFSLVASGSVVLNLEGTIVALDENSVTLQNKVTMMKVPRSSIESKNLRPGQTVTALVDIHSNVQTWAVPPKKSSKHK